MPKLVAILGAAALYAASWSTSVWSANSFVVESKTVRANTPACTVGVYVSNDIPIVALVMTLESRSQSGGAYIGGVINSSTAKWGMVDGSRVYNSPLGPTTPNWPQPIIVNRFYPAPAPFVVCADPVGAGNTVYNQGGLLPDAVSPDGFFHAAVSTGDPNFGEDAELDPGFDPPGAPSFRIIFPVGPNTGTIEIDSCCIAPANVCSYGDLAATTIYVQVTSGLVTVVPCDCDCHGDPQCDGVRCDLVDVIRAIDVAFRGQPDLPDPSPACGRVTTDVDCSDATDIVDVVKLISVAFGGQPTGAVFCDPCL